MADATDREFFSPLARQPSLAAATQALGVTPPVANRRLLCAAPTYLAANGRPTSPRNLQSHAHIVIRENNTAFNNW